MTSRILLLTLGLLVVAGLGAFGAVSIVVGFAEQHAADDTYVVGFANPGADCGEGAQSFDVATGAALSCVPEGAGAGSDRADFPGFTDAQNDQVTQLAKDLGADGLSLADQQRLQHLVDTLAATVPPARRPHYDEGVSLEPLWGAALAWVGGGTVVVCVLCFVLVLRSAGMRRWVHGR
ncbi:MAG TPA: hypothetical protein VHF06_30080 [Pseudonocardiaceae bacterium]|nr:hypothetical protein [Pseudonocardiaceae bacterium]